MFEGRKTEPPSERDTFEKVGLLLMYSGMVIAAGIALLSALSIAGIFENLFEPAISNPLQWIVLPAGLPYVLGYLSVWVSETYGYST